MTRDDAETARPWAERTTKHLTITELLSGVLDEWLANANPYRGASLQRAVAVSVVFLLVAAFVVLYLTRRPWLTEWWPPYLDVEPMSWKERLTYAAAVATAVGAVIALQVSYRKQRDAEEGRFATLFAEAAAQLGNASPAVRIAGVYALAALADRYKTKRQQVIDALCGYLRLPYQPEAGRGHITTRTSETIGDNPEHAGKVTTTETYRPEDREVRLTIIRVIRDHLLDPTASTTWCCHDLDFTGATFDGGVFQGAIFRGEVSFTGAIFRGEVSFTKAQFDGGKVSFTKAQFDGGTVSFDRADFNNGRVGFVEATFSGGEVSFTKAEFGGATVFFDRATFSGGEVSFNEADIRGALVRFLKAEFSGGEVSFDRAQFGERSRVLSCISRGNIPGILFPDTVSYSSVQVLFEESRFCSGRVTFDRVIIANSVHVRFSSPYRHGQFCYEFSPAGVVTRDGNPFAGWKGDGITGSSQMRSSVPPSGRTVVREDSDVRR